MKEAKEYYNISILDGMLVSNKESVIESMQMVIDDAEKEKIAFAIQVLDDLIEEVGLMSSDIQKFKTMRQKLIKLQNIQDATKTT